MHPAKCFAITHPMGPWSWSRRCHHSSMFPLLQLFLLMLHNQMSHGTPEVFPTSAMQVNEQTWVEKERTRQGRRKTPPPLSLTLVLACLIPPFTLHQIISRLFTRGAHRTLANACLKSVWRSPIFQQTHRSLLLCCREMHNMLMMFYQWKFVSEESCGESDAGESRFVVEWWLNYEHQLLVLLDGCTFNPQRPKHWCWCISFFPLKCLSGKAAGYFMQMRPVKCNVLLKVLCLLAQIYSKTKCKKTQFGSCTLLLTDDCYRILACIFALFP